MSKTKLYTVAAILFLTAFGVQSCNKDTSNPPPRIDITSPVAGKEYKVNNAINVKAAAHDEGGLKSFSVSIFEVNSQGQTLLDSFQWSLDGGTDFIVDSNLITIHNPIHPASGITLNFNFAAADVDGNIKKVTVPVSVKP